MARAQVTKAGAVLAATALAWLAASHFSHESATLELLLHQQQQTLQLLGARDSGGSPAATEADAPSPTPVAPSSTPVAAAPGAATDACLSASLPGLSLPAENADRTFAYSSAGSGTTRHCGGTYTYEQLNGLFEPFCVDWVILGRERGYWSVTGNVRDYVDTDKIHDVEMASVKVPEEAKVPFYQSGKIDIDDFEHQIREAGATVPPTEATVLDFGCGLARLTVGALQTFSTRHLRGPESCALGVGQVRVQQNASRGLRLRAIHGGRSEDAHSNLSSDGSESAGSNARQES